MNTFIIAVRAIVGETIHAYAVRLEAETKQDAEWLALAHAYDRGVDSVELLESADGLEVVVP